MWCTVPDGAGASAGLAACQPAGGVAAGLMAASRSAAETLAAVPVTVMVRIMPAALCPGTVHHACSVWPKTP